MKTHTLPARTGRPAANGSAVEVSPFATFHHEMDQLLDNMSNGFGFTRGRSTALPAVEISEDDTSYRVCLDLPGVEIKDIDLSFGEGLLTLKGERKPPGGEALYSSCWSGTFERVIGIGPDVDENQIAASLKNGVLSILLPKKPERRPRRIEVQ